jgi:hypothetical protein
LPERFEAFSFAVATSRSSRALTEAAEAAALAEVLSNSEARSLLDNSDCSKLSGIRVEWESSAVSKRWDRCLTNSDRLTEATAEEAPPEARFVLAVASVSEVRLLVLSDRPRWVNSWRRSRIFPRALPIESKRALPPR